MIIPCPGCNRPVSTKREVCAEEATRTISAVNFLSHEMLAKMPTGMSLIYRKRLWCPDCPKGRNGPFFSVGAYLLGVCWG